MTLSIGALLYPLPPVTMPIFSILEIPLICAIVGILNSGLRVLSVG